MASRAGQRLQRRARQCVEQEGGGGSAALLRAAARRRPHALTRIVCRVALRAPEGAGAREKAGREGTALRSDHQSYNALVGALGRSPPAQLRCMHTRCQLCSTAATTPILDLITRLHR
jgi:hypothetical protein